MKELSIEEKAKAYDKAFEAASKIYANMKEGYNFGGMEDLEVIFPEFAESEDERKRKGVIRNLEYLANKLEEGFVKYELKERISWLEKQGKSYTKRDVDDAYVEGMAFAKNELEKQGEQTPVWSEEDEHRIKDIIYFLDTAKKHYASAVELDACIDWLKSLKDRYTWKPSSEQIECLHDAIEHYHTNGYPASKLNELYEQMSKIYKL